METECILESSIMSGWTSSPCVNGGNMEPWEEKLQNKEQEHHPEDV